jgi:hypothetical protein
MIKSIPERDYGVKIWFACDKGIEETCAELAGRPKYVLGADGAMKKVRRAGLNPDSINNFSCHLEWHKKSGFKCGCFFLWVKNSGDSNAMLDGSRRLASIILKSQMEDSSIESVTEYGNVLLNRIYLAIA